jgi:hypothetical protein
VSEPGDPILDEVKVLLEELDDVVAEPDPEAPGTTRYRRGARVFARTAPGRLEVRLPADITDAALRTSETSGVAGSPGWLRFAPTADRRDVRDRVAAWFRTAWRHAAG